MEPREWGRLWSHYVTAMAEALLARQGTGGPEAVAAAEHRLVSEFPQQLPQNPVSDEGVISIDPSCTASGWGVT